MSQNLPQNSTNCLPVGQDARHTPKIKVVFRGFFISKITHGASSAMIGALSPALGQGNVAPAPDAECHMPIVHIYKISKICRTYDTVTRCVEITTEYRDFPIDTTKGIALNVINNPRIEVFQRDEECFNRLDEVGNDKKDFRWFVNLHDIHSGTQIKVHEERLSPRFLLNSGVFHASKLSDGEVKIKRIGHPDKRFGRFATEITARICLDESNVAVLQNGEGREPMIIAGGDTPRWEIVFDCTCRSADEHTSDFGNVYAVITKQDDHPIDDKDIVAFDPLEPDPLLQTQRSEAQPHQQQPSEERKTPEVYCSGGNCTSC